METSRPIVLSIAGFDPCAGAGLLADIKTFEQHNVYGLGISTAQTLQTENSFISIKWETEDDILKAIETMLAYYNVQVIKIGIVENISSLKNIVSFIHKKNKTLKIIIDTIIKSSTDFDFWNEPITQETILEILSKTFLITPNYNEILQLLPSPDAKKSAEQLAKYCNVLLKGGHNSEEIGIDYLYANNNMIRIEGSAKELSAKHGSGCVLSAAIAANLAMGFDLHTSCIKAKKYVEQFLLSNNTLLGYHHV
jgi:hydroxymethylpyrimidine/phosphomethylpyrimidine kinase